MNPEPDFKSPESLEMVGDPLRLPTALLSDDPRYRIRPMQQVISALVGGLITTFVVTPMEVVKTRVQTQSQNQARYRPVVSKLCYVFHNGLMTHVCKPNSTNCLSKSAATDAASMRPLRGAMDAFVKIICGNGVFGLWAGLSPTLISALPSTIIYFLTYEYLKHSFSNFYYFWRPRDNNNNIVKTSREASLTIPSVVPMASGICARTVVVTAITPLEMVRIKMQSGYMTYTKLWAVLRTLIKTHGILVLWRGWPPTVMRDAPFSGTYWAAYESIKRACDVTEPTFWFSFMAGAASGGLATFVTMPFDLIATHTQIELGQDVLYTDSSGAGKGSSGASTGSRGSSTVSSSMAKPTVFARLSQIYHKQGIRGLYIGVVPRMLRVVPACAIMISAFEYSKSFFFRYNLDLKHADYRRAN
ncbi:solute carrier family 25 member 40 [Drosophila hydei]|uniref:Solute carrier family 25 member 40 n=1 Tax=Drosophila hydei TaxID=7224 RepID=A0A6J1L092_DROHY|nr:solute carrier family 25 member 40 [Drosophila hydei]XP_023159729.1 solute carrier family 25 member 40 [Drosophila hydei]XP_023159730.1 solute carrier family 25 member 40 [Drosophila hydei]XP_030079941.1 solute carrier family 25 member 40 [Drosophila hydei]